jgi:hypothetical protein
MKLPHLHTHVIDNTRRKHGPSRGLFNRSFHLWLRRALDDERTLLELGAQLVVGKPKPEASVRLHFGGLHSETPLDAHLSLLGQAIYVNTSRGRRLAQAFTKGKGRDLAARIDHGRLSYVLWANPDEYRRGDKRQGSIVVNLLDRLYGQKRYWYEDLDARQVDLVLPEGTYPVDLTLQRQTHGRPKQKHRTEALVVDWSAMQGIPTHYDPSGGWKGDRTYGSAVTLRERRPDWHIDATAALAAWVHTERARTGFRKADEVTE